MAEKKTTKKKSTTKATTAKGAASSSAAKSKKSTAAKASKTAAKKAETIKKSTTAKATTPKKATTKKTTSAKKATAKTAGTTKKTTTSSTKKTAAKSTKAAGTKTKAASTKKTTKKAVSTKSVAASADATKAKSSTKAKSTKAKPTKAKAEKVVETKSKVEAKSTKKSSPPKKASTKKASTSTAKKTKASAAKSKVEAKSTKKATTASTKKTTTKKSDAKKTTTKKATASAAKSKVEAKSTKKTTQKAAKASKPTKPVVAGRADDPEFTADGIPVTLVDRLSPEAQTTQGDPVEHFVRLISKDVPAHAAVEDDSQLVIVGDEEEIDWEEALEAHLDESNRSTERALAEPRREEPRREEPRREAPPRRQRRDDFEDEWDDAPPSGMVKVKVFHPDVDAGGGYIELEVPANEIPPGAQVVSRGSSRQGRSHRPRSSHREERVPESFLPAGGILDAGRKLVAEGRLAINPETEKPTQAPPAPTQPTPSQSTTASAPTSSTPKPAGLGASFLDGLPKGMGGASPSAAKQALQAAFGASPTAKPSLPAAPAGRSPSPPAARPGAIAPKAAAPQPTTPQPPAARSTSSTGGVIVDGRLIQTPGSDTGEGLSIPSIRALPGPVDALSLFELQLQSPNQKPVDAHVMLWKEGVFRIKGRVNDSDPRPRLWGEEGLSGLGREEREEELQRWSMREWWEQLTEKGEPPVAAFAGSRVVRDPLQVAFLHDPSYNIYRLYQAAGLALSGDYHMLLFQNGKLEAREIALDGLGEKERITEERMQGFLGEGSTPDLALTAIPCMTDGQPLDLLAVENLARFRDQLDNMFRFPVLELPNPLGGTGSIQLRLGLWELSQHDEKGASLREDASKGVAICLNANAGFLSDLVRRELWRMKGKPALQWAGFTPKEVVDAVRVAMRGHSDMQKFQPKTPGDYRYNPETGVFEIVLQRERSAHTFLLKGQNSEGESLLGALTLYKSSRENTGLDPLHDYASLLLSPAWETMHEGLRWEQAWLLAPGRESRCIWSDETGLPYAPAVRHMPEWHRGVALGLFLV